MNGFSHVLNSRNTERLASGIILLRLYFSDIQILPQGMEAIVIVYCWDRGFHLSSLLSVSGSRSGLVSVSFQLGFHRNEDGDRDGLVFGIDEPDLDARSDVNILGVSIDIRHDPGPLVEFHVGDDEW